MLITRQSFLRGSAACLAGAVAGFSVRPLAAQQARRLKVANFYAADHSMNRALREVFIPKLESYTKGALTASIHDNSSLGSERELTEGVRIGTIEMGITGGLVSSSLPILAILELPYVFRGFEHAWETFKSPIGQDLAKEFEKLNIKALDWVGNGLRAITNSVRPINSLADCHGIRMRVPPNKVYIETAKALGFSVITTPSGEIFNALAQKVADGQENPPPAVLASKWYEVQEHLAISNHILSYGNISINKKLWDGLPANQKDGLQRAASEFAAAQRKMLEQDSAVAVDQLAKLGMKVTRPDIAPFMKATESVRASFGGSIPGGKELLEKIAAVKSA